MATKRPVESGVSDRFVLKRKLGEGAFGKVHEAIDKETGKTVAIKSEIARANTLSVESDFLRQLSGRPHFCGLVMYKEVDKTHRYLAMTILGPSLQKLRKIFHFRPQTICRIAAQCLEAFESLYDISCAHRDIKPSNMAIGTDAARRQIYVFDFGLASRVRKDEPLRQRGFVGTIRYASPFVHRREQIGFRDDIVSLWYCISEFDTGRLPWSDSINEDDVALIKDRISLASLFGNLPPEYTAIWSSMIRLRFDSKPPYDEYANALRQLSMNKRWREDDPFEWEEENVGDQVESENDGTEVDESES